MSKSVCYHTREKRNQTPTAWLSNFVITCITDQIGLHSVLLPLLIKDVSQEDIEHYLITLIPTTVYKGAALSTFKCLVLSHPFCQELCRQLRATQGWDSTPAKTTHLQHGEKEKGLGSGRAPKYSW